jgi:hypothetical protein
MSDDKEEPSIFILERKSDEKHLGGRVTNFDKWVISIIIGIVFLVLVSPFMFKLSNNITRINGPRTMNVNGSPTGFGLLLHTLIFIIIVRLLMH